ncbi:MAG: hypothetical protein HFG20_02100 [Anaerotruncus sp.]|nr:hypothetical protein [Anaerotruncus sp.]
MKWFRKIGLLFVFLPIILLVIFVAYELLGLCANRIATKYQTDRLQSHLENEIWDIQIVSVYSETGNTSGTGNHVDCLSLITFSTDMQELEVANKMSKHYELDGWSCYINQIEDGQYLFYLNTSAPFVNNIEGH